MKNKKPITKAQMIFGKDFGNAKILNERPDDMLFNEYRAILREQSKTIKNCLR